MWKQVAGRIQYGTDERYVVRKNPKPKTIELELVPIVDIDRKPTGPIYT